MRLQVLPGGILLQHRRDGDSQLRIIRQLLLPLIIPVHIRKRHNLAALQHQQPLIDLGFPAGGQPEEPGHQTGADDGRLLGFHQRDHFVWVLPEQMLPKQALRQLPPLRQPVGILHQRMHPGNPSGTVLILDSVASLRVVLHNLPGATAAVDVQLEENHVFFAGHAQLVVIHQVLNDDGVKNSVQEGHEVGIPLGLDAPEYNVRRNEPVGHRQRLGFLLLRLQPVDFLIAPVGAWSALRMLFEEFRRRFVIVAGAVVVAFAHSGVKRLTFLIDVVREAVLPPAGRAHVP